MKFAKKYVLIDQDNYHRLTESNEIKSTQPKNLFQHPDVKIAKKEHERMEQIANNDELTDSEKLQHHSQALKRYLESFKDAIKLSKPQAILGDIGVKRDFSLTDDPQTTLTTSLKTETESDTTANESFVEGAKTVTTRPKVSLKPKRQNSTNLTVGKIVNSLPGHTRGKAQKLLSEVKKIPSLKWTNDGGVIYRGKSLKGSDIKQLIGDAVGATSRKSSKLSIRRRFNDILDENSVSHKQIGDGRSDYSHFEKMINNIKWISDE